MQLQQQTKVHYTASCPPLELRPFMRDYVESYHKWMCDPELLELTGSEPLSLEQELANQQSWLDDPSKYTFIIFYEDTMVGDINLFFSEWVDKNQCEINIMIAEKGFRGKGVATQALRIVEEFATAKYQKDQVIAKIKKGNTASIKLFQKMGYKETNYSETFQEHELRKSLQLISWQQFSKKYKVSETKI